MEAEAKARKSGDGDDEVTGAGETAAGAAVPKATEHRNFTDPDARIMKRADGSFSYCYNGQAVVDAQHQVIVAVEVNQGANDYGQLIPMVHKAMENLGRMPDKWLADTGYFSKANLEQALGLEGEHGTEFFISTRRLKHSAPIPDSPRGRIPSRATVASGWPGS
ncbi:hypothetical protein GCM10025778_25440 [Paeniglutamicibacter antarcticus]|uniref:DDE family transposase n=1 Tax=Paeniglutamicibacter antarcticus TaxID=494023 RepID=A0ABP9TNP7_9MICC